MFTASVTHIPVVDDSWLTFLTDECVSIFLLETKDQGLWSGCAHPHQNVAFPVDRFSQMYSGSSYKDGLSFQCVGLFFYILPLNCLRCFKLISWRFSCEVLHDVWCFQSWMSKFSLYCCYLTHTHMHTSAVIQPKQKYSKNGEMWAW